MKIEDLIEVLRQEVEDQFDEVRSSGGSEGLVHLVLAHSFRRIAARLKRVQAMEGTE